MLSVKKYLLCLFFAISNFLCGAMDFRPKSCPPAFSATCTPIIPFHIEPLLDPVLSVAFKQGPNYKYKTTMQDRCSTGGFVFEDRYVQYWGVFDGHGGDEVVSLVAKRLPAIIAAKSCELKELSESVIREAFKEMQAEVIADTPCEHQGTTVVIAIKDKHLLYIAWVGDSRAVLVRNAASGLGKIVWQSSDHSPRNKVERNRLMRCRFTDGVELFVDQDQICKAEAASICVSRAFGDHFFDGVVISDPEIKVVNLLEDPYTFLLLMSDGVYGQFEPQIDSSRFAAQYVFSCWDRRLLSKAASCLLNEIFSCVVCDDDATALILFFQEKSR